MCWLVYTICVWEGHPAGHISALHKLQSKPVVSEMLFLLISFLTNLLKALSCGAVFKVTGLFQQPPHKVTSKSTISEDTHEKTCSASFMELK